MKKLAMFCISILLAQLTYSQDGSTAYNTDSIDVSVDSSKTVYSLNLHQIQQLNALHLDFERYKALADTCEAINARNEKQYMVTIGTMEIHIADLYEQNELLTAQYLDYKKLYDNQVELYKISEKRRKRSKFWGSFGTIGAAIAGLLIGIGIK